MNDKDLEELAKEIDIAPINPYDFSITSPQWNGILGSYNNYTYNANTTAAANPYGNNTTLNSNWANGSTISGVTFTDSKFHVKQDAEFDGDIKWKGRSLDAALKAIESRLAILTPDSKKLEKYEALRKAYEHYLLMEKLVGED